MPEAQNKDPRRATAERNVEAILDAVERLVRSGRAVSISAVATESGVSRVTVYAHFRDRRELLEAVVERAVARSMTAIKSADLDRGPPGEALARLVSASWTKLADNREIAAAAASELSSEAMHRSHERARGAIRELVDRGRRDGEFRSDLEPEWLITTLLALVHAAAERARSGEVDSEAALADLRETVAAIFIPPARAD
jgi:TetR/AcrR family transcriptional regulator, mexCD-oprJ operon repressor